jgi:hypothetical protein
MSSTDVHDVNGTNRTFVFVPVLMAAGAALSGVAWLVQKIAGATVRPGAERRLAGQLTALTAPPADAARVARLEERPPVPPARPARNALLAGAGITGAALLAFLVVGLADATQTRAEEAPDSVATTVVFEVDVRGDETAEARDLAARELWETCRRSTAAANHHATMGALDRDEGVYAAAVGPALTDHDVMRLRGCLNDATANRTTATVLGEGQAAPR